MEYGLLGRKLGHSFSPEIHEKLGGYKYGLIEVEPENLKEFFGKSEFKGINVTIPYKRAVMEFCDEISEISRAANSVNSIVRRDDGSLYGTNTDYYGFKSLVEHADVQISGKKCLILGTGGVSGTVHKALEDMGAKAIVFISRSGPDNYENISRHYDAEVIVNTTPVGMYPNNGQSPVEIDEFTKLEGVIDLIYNPLKTKLVLDAEAKGIRAVGGLLMLVAQAAEACELFIGQHISMELTLHEFEALKKKQENIVLIGMPGSGKSSVGKELSVLLDKNFVDTDEEITAREGRTPEEIIKVDGEDAFREIETAVLRDVTKANGQIIASGGGIVTRRANYQLIRQNSIVVYINRKLDDLATDERPISQREGIKSLYEKRNPLYNEWADFMVDNIDVVETAKAIASNVR